jgi:RNA polymerase sigma-B factor
MPGLRRHVTLSAYQRSIESLARRHAVSRNPELREQLVTVCTPLIRLIASDFAGSGVPHDDLVQLGYLGLLTAIAGFDPTRGVQFATYARPFIRGEMLHFLRDNRDVIRRPRWLGKAQRQIEDTVRRHLEDEGRFPAIGELARALKVDQAGIVEILRAREATRAFSLDALEEPDNVEIDRAIILHKAYESFQLPVEDRLVLYEAIETLSDVQRQVVYHLFFRDQSQPKAAAAIGISQRHVSRVLASALSRLRERLAEAG